MADSGQTLGQPCMVLDPTQASMIDRSTTVGETTLVPAHLLYKSNFHKVYKGTGTPERPNADAVLRSVSAFAEELAVPLFEDVSNSEAERRRQHFASMSGTSLGEKVAWAAGGLGAASGVATGVEAVGALIAGAALGPGLGLIAVPLLIGGSAAFFIKQHYDRQDDAAQIVDSSKKAVEVLKAKFRLERAEGPFVLYSSESTVVENYDWRFEGSSVWPRTYELKFYKALNKALAQDDLPRLKAICPFIKMLNYHVNMTRYRGGEVYSGVSVSWKHVAPLLREGTKLRIPRVLSTSEKHGVASSHALDKEGLTGLLLVIVIPRNFWGARDLADVSQYPDEAEVVFPPWSQFVVRDTAGLDRKPPELHLEAIDKYAS